MLHSISTGQSLLLSHGRDMPAHPSSVSLSGPVCFAARPGGGRAGPGHTRWGGEEVGWRGGRQSVGGCAPCAATLHNQIAVAGLITSK